ncbi:MAG: sigma-54 dependent transcriptional regulator [Zhengella sp.]|uniref:sigma-54-dependent transcriptional regulator n=1 Tax=Zhengella sp. TaxID=2282762 RepID=UPI001D803011|nr:sigma-54-dependent Fis family transcriptional regulator [Notoacmeibacter sp.]MCC0027646.1 sigma-54-dependent Fis family transcriptional regulator [Brucellaceae bacterium]
MTHTILAVDDDPVQRRLAEAALSRAGHTVLQAENGESALDLLSSPRGKEVSGVLLDLVMPGMNGLAVLKEMRARGQEQPVIVQTAQGSIDTVIAAMRAGAFDFVVKPAAPDRLAAAFAGALKVNALAGKARKTARPGPVSITFKDIVTRSPSMDRVLTLARKAAGSTIPIMIEGESGTGKELLARAIQGASVRGTQPFVTVNCGAIPENLVESILFGHEKGAFTGATEKHQGKFVEANGGTLFLDEIGDLPLEAQVKLLRAVQEGEVDAVGAARSQKVDIRLISATHRDLMQAVRDGQFREDLYYRLNVFPIRMPPLRERREDIPFLVSHFIKRHARADGEAAVLGISAEALHLLTAYDWPGNIRQLENAVFRAVVLAEREELGPDEFPQIRTQVEGIAGQGSGFPAPERPAAQAVPASFLPRVPEPPVFIDDPVQAPGEDATLVRALDARGHVRALADIELDMIRLAITHYEGQMSEVARRLGIGRSTLYRKLKEYGIEPEAERAPRIAS